MRYGLNPVKYSLPLYFYIGVLALQSLYHYILCKNRYVDKSRNSFNSIKYSCRRLYRYIRFLIAKTTPYSAQKSVNRYIVSFTRSCYLLIVNCYLSFCYINYIFFGKVARARYSLSTPLADSAHYPW